MAKVKNKRNAGLADRVQNKKKSDNKKLNPFEVHINREKIKVLGKKSKHDRGLPGVSRGKAIQKRKETLGTEMKLMNKTNAFIDRRIGEKNNQLSAEDRMIARFAAERNKQQQNKKNIYNLADDEILTHRGQTLEQIEKFDDPRSDNEDDEEGKKFGGLDDDFVSEGHFGGGILSRTESKDGAKSHKDLIEQLIAESKKRKAEKQKEKEQTLDLTEKLDSDWKDLQPVVFKRARVESEIEKELSKDEKKNEDYDKMMRELRFEKRGTPSDGLKTDEKHAKEEREKLEQWEKERDRRMNGEETEKVVKTTTFKHRSADDLDDNFELEDEKEFMLAYDKDGKPLVPDEVLKNYTVPNAKPKFDDGVSDTSSDDNSDEEEGSDDENEDDSEDKSRVEKSDGNNEKPPKVERGGLFPDSNDESDDDDADSDEETVQNQNLNTKKQKDNKSDKSKELTANDNENKTKDDNSNSKSSEPDDEGSDDEEESGDEESGDDASSEVDDKFKDLRESDDSDDEIDEESEEKIGSFFELRTTEGDNLKELFKDKTPAQHSTALEKLIKSYDPGLAENNKDLLSRLFAHLLQYINDIFTNLKQDCDVIKSFLIFDRLVPHMYDLIKLNKVSTKKFLGELLKEKHEYFMKNTKKVPDLDTLIFFKLISILYPTSDFRHPLTTPSLLFMSEILRLCRFVDGYSISRGLFVTSLILEYTSLSKRFVPAAINFLRGLLYLSANTSVLNPIQVVPPFRLHKDAKVLNLEEDCSKMAVDKKMAAKDLVSPIDTDFKIRCFTTTCLMLREFFNFFNELEAQECIFEPHIKLLDRIDLDNYPKKVSKLGTEVQKYMKECLEVKTFTQLTREKKRPKALRLYEPDIQEVFTGSKSSKLSREESERKRLQSKYKKEMKGALREIRRDKAYIASVKIKQKIHSDNIRKEKVKQIYKDASIQQSELNKLKRMK